MQEDSYKDTFRNTLSVWKPLLPLVCVFLACYVCGNLMLFLKVLKYKSSSMAIRSSCGYQNWMIQSSTTTTALVLFQLIFASVWPFILKRGNIWKQLLLRISGNTATASVPALGYHETHLYLKQTRLFQASQILTNVLKYLRV